MAVGVEVLKGIQFLRKNVKTLLNLGLSGSVVAINAKIKSDLFDCPVENHQLYGYVYLIAPCVILYFVNLLVVANKLNPHGFLQTIKEKLQKETKFTVFRDVILPSVSRAFAAPLAWLIVSFAQGDYYICATVGPGPEKRYNLNEDEKQDLAVRIAASKSTSQIVAWFLLGVAVLWTFKVKALKTKDEGELTQMKSFLLLS